MMGQGHYVFEGDWKGVRPVGTVFSYWEGGTTLTPLNNFCKQVYGWDILNFKGVFARKWHAS